LTELALRVSVLGEPNPLGMMAGPAELANPVPEVVTAGVSAEALRAICELVLTEVLVTRRGVTRYCACGSVPRSPVGGPSSWSGWRPASTASPERRRMLQGTVAL
jgi:hypothetical protein